MNRSRLTKRQAKKSLVNLFWSILGIIAVIFLLVKFGIPLLVNFSLFISGSRANQESKNTNQTTFIPAPIFTTQDMATNSATTTIKGSTLAKNTVVVYVNGNIADKISAGEDGNFSSEIALSRDENIVKAKAVNPEGKESEFSQNLIIVFKSTPPTLEVSSPSNNDSYSKDQNIAEVKGKTDPQVRVTINGFWAVIDEENNFSYNLMLKEGLNEIKIEAADRAGNKTEKKLSVTYSP